MADQTEDKKIRVIYNPTDEAKQTIRMVYDRKHQMEDSEDRQKAESGWDKWEKQYEAWREKKVPDDWQSNHTVPLTTSVVETALSEMIRQNLRPFVLPRGLEDQDKAKVMQYIWDYAWDVSGGDVFMFNVIKDLLMFGTVIAQEYYRKEERKVGTTTMVKGKEETEYKTITEYDDVCSEVVRLQDFYVDEFARGFDGPYAARDCIRRYVMNIDDFHTMYDNSVWDQFQDASKVQAGGEIDYYEFFKPPEGMDTSKQVEVLHYWNKPKDKFIIVANDILIRNAPNPYKHKQLPFIRGVDLKRVHRFYGKGEPELLESIQDELNVLRRMIIDRNHLDIDKMFIVSNKMGLNDEDLMARPHGMIPTDDPNGAKPVEYGDIPRSVELSLKHLEDDATISTGINPRAQALPTAGTATEAAILKESTLRRIEVKLWLLKHDFLVRLGQLRVSNILQFYPQPKLEKILGDKRSSEYQQKLTQLRDKGALKMIDGQNYEQQYRQIRLEGKELSFDGEGKMRENTKQGVSFFELNPDYYVPGRGGYDLKFQAGSNIEISKPLMQSKILELYDRLMQVSLQVPNSYDPVKIGDMVIEDYFDKNPDDYKPDPPQEDEQEQRLMMQVELASLENQQMIKGIPVPATEFVSPVHTRVHLEFMNSDKFQDPSITPDIAQVFTDHVIGEMMAQEARGMQGVGSANPNMPMQAQGGFSSQGNETTRTSVSQGIQNKTNGMAKPANKIGDILPSLNTGGNKNLS